MKRILFFVILLPCFSSAAELDCALSENLKVILKKHVTTSVGTKQKIADHEGTSFYVSEKENSNFDLEAFVADYEARFYSSGNLVSKGNHLGQTIWNRSRILEVDCTL